MLQLSKEWNQRAQPKYTIFLLLDPSSLPLVEKIRDKLIEVDKKQIIINDLLRIPLIDFEGYLNYSQFELLEAFIDYTSKKYKSINFQFTQNFRFENNNVIWDLKIDENFKKIQFELMCFKWPKHISLKAYIPQIPLYLSLKHEHTVAQKLQDLKKEINIAVNHETHSIGFGQFSRYNNVTQAITIYSLNSSKELTPSAYNIEEEKSDTFLFSSL